MASRSGARLRTKIVALLASLVALWAFAAVVTVTEGVNVVWFATLEQKVGKSTEAVVATVQTERRDSIAVAAGGASASRADLVAARAATDQSIRKMIQEQGGTFAQWSMQGATHARLGDFRAGLATLAATRIRIDAGTLDPDATAAYFTDLVRQAEAVYDTFEVWDDSAVIYATTSLVMMTQGQEAVSEEDAVMTGVYGLGTFTDADRAAFAEHVGTQRYLTTTIAARLAEPDGATYRALLSGPAISALRQAEDRIATTPAGHMPTVSAQQWRSDVDAAIDGTRAYIIGHADLTVTRTRGAVIWVLLRLILAAGLGLVAVIASIRFSIRTVRSLQDQLTALRESALELAEVRLPRVVEQLRLGEDVDVAMVAPPLPHGTDDIGRVGAAFNVVQETAIRAAVEQAELRRGVRDVFLNLARRSQAILHRQLKLLDTMERRATTETELADLFRVDHLATRMRRNAENLIVLSGSVPGRAWRNSVPMVDVVRGALAEIEEYTRVQVRSVEPAALAGRAVGDVIHLVAELMENAVSFSPANTIVQVTGQRVPNGYAIEIEDRGLGMTEPDLVDANDRIADPPEFALSATSRLGFYVVGRLSQRHHVTVRLRTSPYAGTTAIVTFPAALIESGIGPVRSVPDPRRGLAELLGSVSTAIADATRPPSDFRPGASVSEIRPGASVTAPPETEPRLTPSGLPLRPKRPKRQIPTGSVEPGPSHPNGRDPIEIRRIMNAYQQGANRGRARAEHDGITTDGITTDDTITDGTTTDGLRKDDSS